MVPHLGPADALTAIILIVDDTPVNLSILAALLQPTYRVLVLRPPLI